MITALMKLGIEGIYLNKMKATYEKSITNIIVSGEKLKAFPQVRNETRLPTVPTLIQK
jgi:hypothetical protein